MRRWPGHRPGRVQPKTSLFGRSSEPTPITTPPFWASASSGQIIIQSWMIYDATTGPVRSPAVEIPLTLPDTGIVQRRRIDRTLASDTINAVGVATGQFLPNFVSQWSQPSDTFTRLLTKKPLPETVDPITIPTVVLQWVEHPPFRRLFVKLPLPDTVNPVGVATGQFLPNFVTQWLEQFQLSRIRRNNAAAASSTTEPISTPAAAAPTIASASSGQITITAWSVYDPTAGPVLPPQLPVSAVLRDDVSFLRLGRNKAASASSTDAISAPPGAVAAPPTVASASTEQFVINTWSINFATNIVIAIPIVGGQFWYEALDVPTKIKGKNFALASSTEQLIRAPAAPAQPTIASASSGLISLNTWSLYDPTTGPVSPPTVVVAPPLVLSDATKFSPLRGKGRLDDVVPPPVAAGEFLPNFLPQWAEQPQSSRRRLGPRQLDESAKPTFPPAPPVAPPTIGADWMEGSIIAATRRKMQSDDGRAHVDFVPPPPPATAKSEWIIRARRRGRR